jgi:hypothetical protein
MAVLRVDDTQLVEVAGVVGADEPRQPLLEVLGTDRVAKRMDDRFSIDPRCALEAISGEPTPTSYLGER